MADGSSCTPMRSLGPRTLKTRVEVRVAERTTYALTAPGRPAPGSTIPPATMSSLGIGVAPYLVVAEIFAAIAFFKLSRASAYSFFMALLRSSISLLRA